MQYSVNSPKRTPMICRLSWCLSQSVRADNGYRVSVCQSRLSRGVYIHLKRYGKNDENTFPTCETGNKLCGDSLDGFTAIIDLVAS